MLGAPPGPEQLAAYLGAYFGDRLPHEAVAALSAAPPGAPGLAAARAALERAFALPPAAGAATSAQARADAEAALEEAGAIADLLRRNVEEVAGVLAGLEGRYVPPEAGGDLLRDGPGVLPTGRNIHALDPYRMPGLAALERGAAAAAAVLDAHRAANGGAWPETVAVNLWGLDAIKTKGESVAMVLHLVGAAPVKEATGRIARFELLPLEALGGRPRVDVLCNMSGIFRDAFQNVVELLDDLFARAAAADEDPEMNYIRKHALAMVEGGGVDARGASARLFSNPAGDYGSMVNERVGARSAGVWGFGGGACAGVFLRCFGACWAGRIFQSFCFIQSTPPPHNCNTRHNTTHNQPPQQLGVGRRARRHVGRAQRVQLRPRRRARRRAPGGAAGALGDDRPRRPGGRLGRVRAD